MKTSSSNFLDRFKRITNGGSYMPEIDGLRFIAVFLVAFVMHLGNLLREWQLGIEYDDKNIIHLAIMEGSYGVVLFFVISGFILGLPFARQKLLQQKPVSLKEYFVRRITRIEPPYIITMILYFAMRVWVLHYDSFKGLLPYFFASVFYVHNIVYKYPSAINGVAWSLEVEVQFYLLAPLLTNLYYIKNKHWRRGIMLVLITAGAVFSYINEYHVASILDKGCFFISGMLLADWYLLREKDNNGKGIALFSILLFVIFLFVPMYYVSIYPCIIKTFATLLFFYLAITNDVLRKLLSTKIITIIGGMCYSIYLLHMGLYGLMRHRFFKIQFFDNSILNVLLQYVIGVTAVLILSAVFFLLVEKPTMQRHWYKKIFIKKTAQGL